MYKRTFSWQPCFPCGSPLAVQLLANLGLVRAPTNLLFSSFWSDATFFLTMFPFSLLLLKRKRENNDVVLRLRFSRQIFISLAPFMLIADLLHIELIIFSFVLSYLVLYVAERILFLLFHYWTCRTGRTIFSIMGEHSSLQRRHHVFLTFSIKIS